MLKYESILFIFADPASVVWSCVDERTTGNWHVQITLPYAERYLMMPWASTNINAVTLPRVINFKFPLQARHKYHITPFEELGFSLLTQMKNNYATNSHYLTYTFLFKRLGKRTFWVHHESRKFGLTEKLAFGSSRVFKNTLLRPKSDAEITYLVSPHVRIFHLI